MLLETIEKNGEFEKYVEMLANRQEKEQRELRRRAREMRRLEQGDAYISSQSEGSGESEEESYDNESYGDLEEDRAQTAKSQSQNFSPDKRNKEADLGDIGDGLKAEQLTEDDVALQLDQLNVVNESFNPLRFIAQQLKELNE